MWKVGDKVRVLKLKRDGVVSSLVKKGVKVSIGSMEIVCGTEELEKGGKTEKPQKRSRSFSLTGAVSPLLRLTGSHI